VLPTGSGQRFCLGSVPQENAAGAGDLTNTRDGETANLLRYPCRGVSREEKFVVLTAIQGIFERCCGGESQGMDRQCCGIHNGSDSGFLAEVVKIG
jgi:hypothetical protein